MDDRTKEKKERKHLCVQFIADIFSPVLAAEVETSSCNTATFQQEVREPVYSKRI